MYILSFNVGCDKCVSCLESGDVRMSGDDHLSPGVPGSALSGVDILSAQHHLCQDLASEIFMNL